MRGIEAFAIRVVTHPASGGSAATCFGLFHGSTPARRPPQPAEVFFESRPRWEGSPAFTDRVRAMREINTAPNAMHRAWIGQPGSFSSAFITISVPEDCTRARLRALVGHVPSG